jgi:hypothetical protein
VPSLIKYHFLWYYNIQENIMTQEHYVMTVQNIWNSEPHAAVTASGILETDGMTAQEVYDQARLETIASWRKRYPHMSLGEVAVLFYNREPNQPVAP